MEIVDLFMEKSKDKFSLDDYTLLLFCTDLILYIRYDSGHFNNPLQIAKSNNILQLKWGEQNYHYIINDNKAYDLKAIKED